MKSKFMDSKVTVRGFPRENVCMDVVFPHATLHLVGDFLKKLRASEGDGAVLLFIDQVKEYRIGGKYIRKASYVTTTRERGALHSYTRRLKYQTGKTVYDGKS